MKINPPTSTEIRTLAQQLGFDFDDADTHFFQEELATALESIWNLDERYERVVPERQQPNYDRRTEFRSTSDPHNTWISRCDITGAGDGPLSGWNVAIKDNVSVAGVEMTCGSDVLRGYVPDIDATIVRRLLDAGARIVGKTNMDDMAFSAKGAPSAFGPIRNPHDDDYLAGGSSGGSATAVVTEQADVAIGSDQGGSIRVPAAHCGIVGHKPTYGLVPYTGGVGLEYTIDHFGPMASDVSTVATTLSVIAGTDPADPRQPRSVPVETYEEVIDDAVDDLSIGVLREGFESDIADSDVNERVRAGIDELVDAGAVSEHVSVPMHSDALDIHLACLAEGLLGTIRGEGLGSDRNGWFNTSWVEAFGKFRRAYGDAFPPGVKLVLLLGAYLSDSHHSRHNARARNLQMTITQKYETLFDTYDILALPTTPLTAPEYDPERDYYDGLSDEGVVRLCNTCPFNRSGHPALSVPVGAVDGLPVGLMLVGDHFADGTVLSAGNTVTDRI